MIARVLVRGVPFYKRNRRLLCIPLIPLSSTKNYNNKMEEITAKVEQVKIGKHALTQKKSRNSLLPPLPPPKERSRQSQRFKPLRSKRSPRRRRSKSRRNRSPLLRTRTRSVPSSSAR
jgi:hypothetical protein